MKLSKSQVTQLAIFAKEVEDKWPHRKGKSEFVMHLLSKETTRKESMIATCYICCGGYEDGPYDCKSITCPLYPYMPYRDARARQERSEEEKQALVERLAKARGSRKGSQ